MKVLVALISLLALSGVALFMSGNGVSLQASNSDFEKYTQWKAQFNKNTNGVEDEFRFVIFQQNLRFIEENNAKTGNQIVLGLTQFADQTNEEYKEKFLTKIMKNENVEYVTLEESNADSIDWVAKGAVTSVKNQGQCGSCWAFSTVVGLEGAMSISTGKLENLSEQQVTSCVPAPFSLGCNGGNPLFGYTYTSLKGIETAAAYPYVQEKDAKTAECKFDASKVVYQNKGVGQVPENSPSQMLTALQTQPLSIAVDAGSIYFQLYNSGVIKSENCGTSLNHAIGLVGYDSNENTWRVKNSWGTGWGEKGYANVLNVEGEGICGINMDVSFPTF